MNIGMAMPLSDCPKCGAKQSVCKTYSKDYPDGRYECGNCDYVK